MSREKHIRLVQEVDTQSDTLVISKPFKLETDERRRYVRLEISSPMGLQKVKDIGGRFWPRGEHRVINGLILNISASGVLIEVTDPVNEGDVVVMRFTLQEVEQLEHVLGLVKRADFDGEAYLIGVEFITREDLSDSFTALEMSELSSDMTDFDGTVRTVLNKYIRSGHQTRGDNGR